MWDGGHPVRVQNWVCLSLLIGIDELVVAWVWTWDWDLVQRRGVRSDDDIFVVVVPVEPDDD